MIKLALVDDEVLFRKGLKILLDNDSKLKVIFDGNDGKEFTDYLKNNGEAPDVVLLDIRMPRQNGIETSKILSDKYPEIKIIIVSSYESDLFIEQMIHFGASSYLLKNTDPVEMIYTIKQVDKNGMFFAPRMQQLLLSTKKDPQNHLVDLSEQELKILQLIYKQCSGSEIAKIMCLSERTVEGYRLKLMKKTNSKNVVGLILYSIKHNLLAPI